MSAIDLSNLSPAEFAKLSQRIEEKDADPSSPAGFHLIYSAWYDEPLGRWV